MTKLLGFKSTSTDPYLNLAIENWILNNLSSSQRALFMWTNSPCVVMGRFQNPWLECNLDLIREDKVVLVRRQSGGGCVYHDEGNVNHSFLSANRDIDKKSNSEILINGLKRLDIKVEANDRFDITFKGKKVSGSAFKQKKDRSFHHGTMLLNSNLEKLNLYIRSKLEAESSRSIPSVRSIVENLKCDSNEYQEAIFNSFETFYRGNLEIRIIKEKDALKTDIIISYMKEIKNFKWLLGETPKFELINSNINSKIISHKGLIKDVFMGELSINEFKDIPLVKKEVEKVNSINLSLKEWIKGIAY